MGNGEPLIFSWGLDGKGGGRPLSWESLQEWSAIKKLAPCWIHLVRHASSTREWLNHHSGLDRFICEALAEPETRPRCLSHKDGVILFLRGVNLNSGEEAHDMLTLRLWAGAEGLVTLVGRRMRSPEDIHVDLQRGQGPKEPGDLLVLLLERLTERMAPVIATMGVQMEELEQETLVEERHRGERKRQLMIRKRLARLRMAAVSLRRYLGPQREALNRLAAEPLTWLTDEHRLRLKELVDDSIRLIEDLDEIRDTAGIVQDQIKNDMSETMNTLLYKLTLFNVIFMPLSFIVGFFGSNVGGVLWGGNPADPTGQGFLNEGMLLFGVATLELLAFRWMRWL
ncbi:MAG: zinc transporter ZntB [Magnetococcales bacterium]|nr:zinc transporter ZntB [Magnetococcales bacterium]